MAVAQTHALAVAGIAVVALAGGYGIARATGGDETPPPAKPQSRGLAAVDEAGTVRVAGLRAVAVLPAPKSSPRRQRRDTSTSKPSANPAPSSTTAPAPAATTAPPSSAPAPPQSKPAPPQPERTPVVGGGTGGEEP